MAQELIIKHTMHKIETTPQAFRFGFAEGFGKALGFALVFGLTVVVIKAVEPNEIETPVMQIGKDHDQ